MELDLHMKKASESSENEDDEYVSPPLEEEGEIKEMSQFSKFLKNLQIIIDIISANKVAHSTKTKSVQINFPKYLSKHSLLKLQFSNTFFTEAFFT